jgi:hypothetical protein
MTLLLALALRGPLAAAQAPADPAPVEVVADAVIEGMIFLPDGAPLAGAELSAADARAITDELGHFRLAVPAGSWAVAVRVDGLTRAVDAVPAWSGLSTELLLTWDAASPDAPLPALVESPLAPDAGSQAAVDTAPPGVLRGRIVQDDGGKPVVGARVFVRGRTAQATTDEDGHYTLDLPVGTWEISVIASGFASQVVRDQASVDPTAPPPSPTEIRLLPAGLALDDFYVRAPKITGGTATLMEERQEATGVADVIGAEQMRKAGDPDAAQALRRATGVTVVGGRYVYVRGLGDRYAATTLNGSTLPSPEPEKRVVPLDLFPTSVLEGVVIVKTPSPDLPAEFGGGIVQIRTRGVPSGPLFSVSGSLGARTGVSFREAQLGARAPGEVFGVSGGTRALPDLIAEQAADQPIKPRGLFSDAGFDADQIEAFGESLPNRWDTRARRIGPDGTLQLTWGDRHAWGDREDGPAIGALVGVNWGNSWGYDDAFRKVFSTSDAGLVLKRDTRFRSAQNRVTLGGIATLAFELGDAQEVVSTTLLNRVSEYEALTFDADDPTGSNDTRGTRLAWAEQQLIVEQLRGHHELSEAAGVGLDWRYAFSRATRLDPDRREYTYLKTDSGYVLSQKGTWNELTWGSLADRNHDAQLDLKVEVLRKAERPGQIKLGGMWVDRRRSSNLRRFSFELRGIEGIDLASPIGEVLTPDTIGAEGPDDGGYAVIGEGTSNSDDYVATQRLGAGYAMADLPLHPRVRWMFGARVESSTQIVSTFELFNAEAVPVEAKLATTDVLPSSTITLGVGGKRKPESMLLRVSYGRTLSRPEFRELSTVPFNDFRTGVLYFGNPAIQRALIDHVDVRWEWYPSPGESLSVAGFYKAFRNPIEQVTAVSAVSGLASTFDNAERASNLGLELDFRLSFEHAHRALRDLYFSGNAAFIRSRIDLGDASRNDTSAERPLQGQSPWVMNLSLGYDNPESGVSATLLYNVFGPRILDVGQSGIPDTYELPVHRLDLVGLIPLRQGWQLRLRASNLLDSPIRQRTGDEIAEQQRDGVGFSVGAQWNGALRKPRDG